MTLSTDIPHAWIEKIRSLPVLPQVAMKITERIQSPNATLSEISDLIRSDVGLSANILRLANSSYYSIPGGVSEIPKALQYLGLTTIAQSILTSSFFGSFKTKGLKEFPLLSFWTHSFAVGILSEIAAQSLQLKNSSEAFLGGLMHDVGKLVLLEVSPEDLSRIVKHAESNKTTFIQAEDDLGFVAHTVLGSEFGKYWRLPSSVTASIREHHSDPKTLESLSIQTQIIAWANLWVQEQKFGFSGNYFISEALPPKKISPHQIKSIEEKFHREFEKAGAMLSGH